MPPLFAQPSAVEQPSVTRTTSAGDAVGAAVGAPAREIRAVAGFEQQFVRRGRRPGALLHALEAVRVAAGFRRRRVGAAEHRFEHFVAGGLAAAVAIRRPRRAVARMLLVPEEVDLVALCRPAPSCGRWQSASCWRCARDGSRSKTTFHGAAAFGIGDVNRFPRLVREDAGNGLPGSLVAVVEEEPDAILLDRAADGPVEVPELRESSSGDRGRRP